MAKSKVERTVTTLLSIATLLVFAASVPTAWSQSSSSTPRQWRLIWTEAPQKQAMVCWNTVAKGKSHQVCYDTKSRRGNVRSYTNRLECTRNGAYSKNLYYHHAQLKGLKPETTYYFVMVSDGEASKEFHFITASARDIPFKIIFGGDSRSGVDSRRKMNKRIAKLADADETILALAHGGDYVKSGTNLKLWEVWMTDHELTVTSKGRILPLIPARGNHESRGPIYDMVLGFPGGAGKNYFATDLSPEVLFITLNSETKADGAQRSFLEKTLKVAANKRWKVAQYHKPCYPAVKKPGPGLKHWAPLFEKYNLALACEADGHCIKRTVPIRNNKVDRTGVVYIGEGGLGVGQRKPKAGLWYLKAPGMVSRGNHVQLLSFSKDKLQIDVIGMDGKFLDQSSIPARKR